MIMPAAVIVLDLLSMSANADNVSLYPGVVQKYNMSIMRFTARAGKQGFA